MSILGDYQSGRCYLCGGLMAPRSEMFAHDSVMPSLDHVLPKCKGGTNRLGNVALAHKQCNNRKADRLPTACEAMFAAVMARCFEDSHVREPYQGFQEARSDQRPENFRLHIRGKGFMYVREPGSRPYVTSRSQYRARLKRLAMEKRIGSVAEVA